MLNTFSYYFFQKSRNTSIICSFNYPITKKKKKTEYCERLALEPISQHATAVKEVYG